MRTAPTVIGLAAWLLCFSCASPPTVVTTDARERMLAASKKQDPNFPDGQRLKLTRFAYMGTVIADGQRLRVIDAAAVIPNMPSPRGQAWLYFFDMNTRLVGKHPVRSALPRWCDGSRVYFFGLEGDGEQKGNALDLSKGFADRRFVMDPRPGSWAESVSAE